MDKSAHMESMALSRLLQKAIAAHPVISLYRILVRDGWIEGREKGWGWGRHGKPACNIVIWFITLKGLFTLNESGRR